MKIFNKDENKPVARNNAYSVYDEKAKAFNLPFFYPQDGLAVRALKASLQNPSSVLSQNPEDFVLYRIGSFSDLDGKLTSLPVPELVVRVLEVVKHVNAQPSEVSNASVN